VLPLQRWGGGTRKTLMLCYEVGQFKDSIRNFLREYNVHFDKQVGGKEFRGQAEVVPSGRMDMTVLDAIGLILASFRGKVLDAFPPEGEVRKVLYVYPPERWEWCHQQQMEWGPSRLFFETDLHNTRLCMGFMVKGKE